MNAAEFMFALVAVFGSTALWFVWVSFVYRLDSDVPKISEKYKPHDIQENKTKFDDNNKVIGDTGIFYFPVWQSDSIVKRQNITTKIPSAIQLATMYGANTNPIQEMENHATSFDATGVAAGGFNNANRDIQLENLNIAIKNIGS